MIDVRDAAGIAVEYLQSLPMMPADAIRLEEVVMSEDEKSWLITLSVVDNDWVGLPMDSPPRLYKTLKVDAEKGDVLSMKIRQLERA
jgi:hypothetical protein